MLHHPVYLIIRAASKRSTGVQSSAATGAGVHQLRGPADTRGGACCAGAGRPLRRLPAAARGWQLLPRVQQGARTCSSSSPLLRPLDGWFGALPPRCAGGICCARRARLRTPLLSLQVWKPTDKNMVGCDGCDFWIHHTCDTEAARVLASAAEDEQYFCPHCRQASAAQVARCAAALQKLVGLFTVWSVVLAWCSWGYPRGLFMLLLKSAGAACSPGTSRGGTASGSASESALSLRAVCGRDCQVRV